MQFELTSTTQKNRVVRSLRLGFDYESGKPMTLKLIFTASLLHVQHCTDGV